MLRARVGPGLVDITAACALSTVTLWKCDAFWVVFSFCLFSTSCECAVVVVGGVGGCGEPKCFPKGLFFFQNTRTCKCERSRRLMRFSESTPCSGWTSPAGGLTLFDLKAQSTSEALNTSGNKWADLGSSLLPCNQLLIYRISLLEVTILKQGNVVIGFTYVCLIFGLTYNWINFSWVFF